MKDKQIGGPLATAVIVVVILIAVGVGYFFMNRGSVGAEAEAKKYNKPGEIPAGADPNKGPFPSDTLPNGQKMGGGMKMPGAGAPPQAGGSGSK